MKNNRLKFRAWDKEFKIIGKVFNINFEDELIEFGEDDCRYKFDEVELMQYTGFKDRNGIEIYEGDIVKGVGKHIGQSNVFYGDIGELQPMSYLNDYNFNNYEVIGNIYENPEIINYI